MSMPLPGKGAMPTTSTAGKLIEEASAAPPDSSAAGAVEPLGAAVGAVLGGPGGAVWAWAAGPEDSVRAAAATAAIPPIRRMFAPWPCQLLVAIMSGAVPLWRWNVCPILQGVLPDFEGESSRGDHSASEVPSIRTSIGSVCRPARSCHPAR